MAACEVFVDTVPSDSSGSQSSILDHAWVYLRRGTGPLEVLRTDGRGMLLAPSGSGAPVDHWWEYTSPYRGTFGEDVRLCFSRGARPVPESQLADAVFVERRLVHRPGQRKGRLASRASAAPARLNTIRLAEALVQLPDPRLQLASPGELQVWPITLQPLPIGDPYHTDLLVQGNAAWNGPRLAEPEFDPNLASHTLERCRAVPPRADIPSRGLRVRGQVGSGATRVVVSLVNEQPRPSPVLLAGTQIVDIAAGYQSTCAVLADGTARCWGRMQDGPCIGCEEEGSAYPGSLTSADTATPIRFERPVRKMALGEDAACVILDDGTLRCWHAEDDGTAILGTGIKPQRTLTSSGIHRLSPGNAAAIDLGGPVELVRVGMIHNVLCAVRRDGALFCWGKNNPPGILGYARSDDIGDDETPASVGPVPFRVPAEKGEAPPASDEP